MKRADQSGTRTSEQRGVLSVKIISVLFVGLLVIGTVPVTHSYPSAKADFNNIWLAAQEFWGSLELFKSQQRKQEVASVELIDSDIVDSVVGVMDESLDKLKNHPECRSIYISEYLPTFNSHVIEKCEKAIKQHEQKQLFDMYVQQLCLNPDDSSLNRKQLGEVQLRLRKYALTFPQSNIEVTSSDVDGIYGVKTCQIIANYQIISKVDVIDGVADTLLYNDLETTIPLSEVELAGISWQKRIEQDVVAKTEKSSKTTYVSKSDFKLPKNPFKRIAFCSRNKHIKKCNFSNQGFNLAKAEMNQR